MGKLKLREIMNLNDCRAPVWSPGYQTDLWGGRGFPTGRLDVTVSILLAILRDSFPLTHLKSFLSYLSVVFPTHPQRLLFEVCFHSCSLAVKIF